MELLPDVARPDANVIVVSDWIVGTPERQQKAADALATAWSSSSEEAENQWPSDLLSLTSLLSVDGKSILNYEQWTQSDAYHAFKDSSWPDLIERIDAEVPGIERPGAVLYELYRSFSRPHEETPGCIVAITMATADHAAARRWVDAVLEAIEGDGGLPPGGLSAHFHISRDGTRAFNYAEWTSVEAHQAALDAGDNGISRGPLWKRVQNMPGTRFLSLRRHRPYRYVAAEPSTRGTQVWARDIT